MSWERSTLVAVVGAFLLGVALTAVLMTGDVDRKTHGPEPGVDHGVPARTSMPSEGIEPASRSQPRISSTPVVVDGEPRVDPNGGKGMQVAFDGQILLVDGVPLEEVDLESWDAEQLKEFREQVRPLQLSVFNDLRARVPLDGFFVSDQEYVDQRRWHEDKVFFAMSRQTDDPEQPIEYGLVEIPHSLSPEAYVLMDAVVRSYRAPAAAAELMAKGTAYEQQVRAKHPDATLDVTDDLTKWTFFAPDGRIVGQTSHTRNANN